MKMMAALIICVSIPFGVFGSELRDSVRDEIISIVKLRYPAEPPEKIEGAADVLLRTMTPFLEDGSLADLNPHLREAVIRDAERVHPDFFENYGSEANAAIFERMSGFSRTTVDYLKGKSVEDYLKSIDNMRPELASLKKRIDEAVVSELQKREKVRLPKELLPAEVGEFLDFLEARRETLGEDYVRVVDSTLDSYFVIVKAEASELIWNELNTTLLDVRYAGQFMLSKEEFSVSGATIEGKITPYVNQRLDRISTMPLRETYVLIHMPLLNHSVGTENYPKVFSSSKDPFPPGLTEVNWTSPLAIQ